MSASELRAWLRRIERGSDALEVFGEVALRALVCVPMASVVLGEDGPQAELEPEVIDGVLVLEAYTEEERVPETLRATHEEIGLLDLIAGIPRPWALVVDPGWGTWVLSPGDLERVRRSITRDEREGVTDEGLESPRVR